MNPLVKKIEYRFVDCKDNHILQQINLHINGPENNKPCDTYEEGAFAVERCMINDLARINITSACRGIFPGHSLLAAMTSDGRVLGSLAMEYKTNASTMPWSVRSLYIHTLFVIPEAQGRGIASKLIRIAEDIARANHVCSITVTVMKVPPNIGCDDIRYRAAQFLRTRHARLVEYYAVRQGFARQQESDMFTTMIKRL